MTCKPRNQTVYSLEQAVGAAPTLAALALRIEQSQANLERIRHLLPMALRQKVQAGPLNEGQWCLLLPSTSASAKLRQLLPSLQNALNEQGAQVTSIRLKIQPRQT